MSLTTLLLALAPALVRAKPASEKTDREKELEGRIDALNDALARALERNERLVVERDSWRRRCKETHDMLARVASDSAARQQLGFQHAQMMAAQPMSQQQMAQYQMQQAMNAQNAFMPGWHDCTCVPARHDALLGIGR